MGEPMALARILPLLLAFVAALFAAAPGKHSGPRALEVLFFGDDAYHHPLDRYAMFKEVAGHRGIHLTYEKRMDALTPRNLAKYDVLLIYANHQEITEGQFAAVKGFVEQGGGLVPVHCGSACFKKHDGYVALVGGQIAGHEDGVFTARVVEPGHSSMAGYSPFETWDETYRHHRLADDITVLQRNGDEPWTWVRTQGQGRVFYTAHGHDERCWKQEGFHELLERGIRWAAGDQAPLAELPELKYEVPLLPDRYRTDLPVPKIQSPLSPEDSMKRAQVPAGFELSLFAAEPDIENPIAITWDELGRLWVVEAIDYPNGLGSGNDRLKVCEDRDGDGRADTFTVFADGLSIATSAVHANGGVIVTSGSQILFLKDSDGDGRADERRVLIDGFNTHDTHAGVSNLRYGFDGWIYGTVGYAGFEGTVGGVPLKFDTGVFRFLPDGSRLEFLGKTSNNTWGLGFTEGFDVLGSTANRQGSWQVVGDGGPVHQGGRGTRVFPITLDVQGSDGWDPPVELLGEGRVRARARHFTAASGHGVYTARLFPDEWWNRTAFVCEPTGHLVAIAPLRNGNADIFADFEGNNLYASSDAWSAPVAAETGPDGAVWIADWYHIIVQHNRPGAPFEQTQVERGKGAAYVTPLRDRPMGRIYRVFPKDSRPDPAPYPVGIAGLKHPSLVVRLHAQRGIVEKGDKEVVDDLVALAKGEHGIHALHALEGLGHFGPDQTDGLVLLNELLVHPSPAIRRTALRLWPTNRRCPFDPLEETDPFVIREWLLFVSRIPGEEGLGRQLRDWHRHQQHLRRGVVLDRCFASAAARHSTGFLLASLENSPDPSVLKESIYPAAIRGFAEGRSPQVIAKIDDSPLGEALKEALATHVVAKKHTPAAERLARGEAAYARTCAACHQTDGSGVDGAFPPLDGSAFATGDASKAIRIVLHGMTGPVTVPGKADVNSLMPPVTGLSDDEIAAVLTYVRHAWTNDAPEVSTEEVRQVRTATGERTIPWRAEELR